nr:putative glycosyltransferase [Anoectochilus roxburghii]
MGSNPVEVKPHAVCVPFPSQGNINPTLELAKLLHAHGFHVTFVLTHFNRRRLVRAQGEEAVKGLPDFCFAAIPDGLPASDDDGAQDIAALCDAGKNCLGHFRSLLAELNDGKASGGAGGGGAVPPVSCIITAGAMGFTVEAARELSIPHVLFWPTSATGFLAFQSFRLLVERGIIPFKEKSDLTNGFLETEVDWIPGLTKGMRLKDFPSFIRTADADDIMLNFMIEGMNRAAMNSAILFNTFDDLEQPALKAMEEALPPIYAIGPFSVLSRRMIPADSPLAAIGASLWKKDASCLQWLDGRRPASVVYVSFGSLAMLSKEQIVQLAWGLEKSGFDFLWVVRPDLAGGESAVLPPEFIEKTKERGMIVSWCAQQEILMHPAVGVFLTHCGWNSMIESLSSGVPVICKPFASEQTTNCKYACSEWGVGVEIDGEMKTEAVERLIREVMAGEKGREMRKRAAGWKESAAKAGGCRGGSSANLKRAIEHVLLCKQAEK